MHTTQPRTFDELEANIQDYRMIKHSLRLSQDQIKYESESSTDIVKNRIATIREKVKTTGEVFTTNNFPYTWLLQYLPNAEHHIYWYDGDKTRFENFKNELEKIDGLRYCYFENQPVNRSIPDIIHYQVFVEIAKQP